MKICRTCGENKPLSEFYKRTKRKSYFADCKICHCIVTGQRIKIKGQKKTHNWVLNEMYFGMIKHSKNRNYSEPNFTNKQFKEWCFSNTEFINIYDKWAESKYNKWNKPSVDRINNYKSYTFDNIRIVTWLENFESAIQDILNGNNTKQCKGVYQYDLNGVLIKEYFSLRSAGRLTNLCPATIAEKAKLNKEYKGYIWSYEKTKNNR